MPGRPPLDGVAVIGMAGRFPGAADVEAFWRNLIAGVESITRFDGDPGTAADGEVYVPARGVLDGVELFDAAFFGISPAEAQVLDPQQRLFLECAWEAFERAGCDPGACGRPVGVFAGGSNNSYFASHVQGHPEAIARVGELQAMMANEKDYLATRTSYKLDLRGPSINVQTACSTSLVAICQAVQSLLAFQCDVALAGGVSIVVPQQRGYVSRDGGITSADGHCRAFDARAQGTVFSNGLAVVVLKRLADAVADGDPVCAVIKAAVVNNDGAGKVSFVAPGVSGHAEAVAAAQAFAGVDARSISYIEAHGTGTALGDVVEVAALTQAFRMHTRDTGFCALGSVKTNIGHLDAAAGGAGLLKAVLALQHRVIPPTLHFETPNPKLALSTTPFFVNTAPLAWNPEGPRRAGVSSLGAGGTNAHVVLEEAPPREPSSGGRGVELLVVSARTPAALDRACDNLRAHLSAHRDSPLADVAFTLQAGRRRFDCRRAVVCRDVDDAIGALADPRRAIDAREAGDLAVGFVFPEADAKPDAWIDELAAREPVFRNAIEACGLRRDGTDDVRAAAFALQFGLYELSTQWGVKPAFAAGRGVGTIAAATAAGVFDPAEAVAFIVDPARRESISLSAAELPLVSPLDGEWIDDAQCVSAAFWSLALDTRGPWPASAALAEQKANIRLAIVGAADVEQVAALAGPAPVVTTLQNGVPPVDAMLGALGALWAHGADVDWYGVHEGERRLRLALPTYPFERERFWLDPVAAPASPIETPAPPAGEASADPARLEKLLSDLSGLPASAFQPDVTFFDLGLDSLFVTQAVTAIGRTFGVKVAFRELLEELSSIGALRARIDDALASAPAAPLRESVSAAARPAAASRREQPRGNEPSDAPPRAHGPFRPIDARAVALSRRQEDALSAFVARYTARTAESKRLTDASRARLADPRTVAGFRATWKELVYPIVVVRSAGATLWDADGHEYIDLVNGFGTNLFGHSPAFVTAAIQAQLARGVEIGPQSPLAGIVAARLCEMTGHERVAFCNTGSEAVSAAVRMARTVTGRDTIAMFTGAYHGTFDEALARAATIDGEPRSLPIAPGIPSTACANVLMLEYGSPASLDLLRARGGDLAALLVEPVQSRRPELQPAAFLREARQITERTGTALVFDEVVSGFRVHPGGVQALFGIRPDIATYGKVVGGGLPIGLVAGRAQYLDALDGGAWQYGDDSGPTVGMTFFAGTFVRHPLALAASAAVLEHLAAEGPALQRELNLRTTALVERLNARAADLGAPVHVAHFSSWFCFRLPSDPYASLFYAYMRHKGIHTWEGRPGFITTAHTTAHLDRIVEAFAETIAEMQQAGFLPSAREPEARPVEAAVVRLPVPDPQQEVWAACQMTPLASASYNQCFPLRVRGPLALDAMRTALGALPSRHQALRARFAATGDHQVVGAAAALPVSVHDVSQHGAAERTALVENLLARESATPFDLASGPLARALIVREAPDEHVLVLTAHHLVCDGKSSGLLLRDLAALYNAARHGLPAPPPDVAPYEDYVRAAAAPPPIETEQYWAERFAEPAPPLDLPTDRPRPPEKTFHASEARLRIDGTQYAGIKQLGARHNCTLYVTLLTAWNALLHRLTSQTDVVVGVPMSGLVDDANVVGHSVHMLPLRAAIDPRASFAAQLAAVRRVVADAHEHRGVTFGRLVRTLAPAREASRPLLFSVVFNVDPPGELPRFDRLEIERLAAPKSGAMFELAVDIADSGAALDVECRYNTDLFDGATVHRWLEHYRTLLMSAAADASVPVGRLPIVTETERAAIVQASRATEVAEGGCLHRRFEEVAARTPEAVAVRCGDDSLTYADLNRRANRIAHRLQALGVGPESRVAVCLDPSLDLVAAILGVLKSGAAYVPIDPEAPPQRARLMLDDAQCAVTLTSEARRARVESGGGDIVLVEQAALGGDPANPQTAVTPANAAYVIYTSGSTGRPKGVVVEHQQASRLFDATDSTFAFDEHDVWTLFHSAAFDFSVWELWGALLYGGRLIVVPYWTARSPVEFHHLLQRERVTVLNQTPSAFRQLMDADRGFPPSSLALRYVIFGGEALETGALRDWVARHGDAHPVLVNMFGITETTVHVTSRRITADDVAAGSHSPIGSGIADLDVFLLSPERELVPDGVPGEICVGGAGVARGYLNRPDLTAERFIPHPFSRRPGERLYCSGDLARRGPDGSLEYLGRADDQVKIRGFRIEPGEIAAALSAHAAVREAFVRLTTTAGDARLVAYVMPADGRAVDEAELMAHLRARVPEYMVPKAFVALDRMPLTANGKIDRGRLPAPADAAASSPAATAPRTRSEQVLARVWCEVLHLPSVGVDDSFFDLGGHSMLAVRIIAAIRERLGVELSMAALFHAPTVARLAEIVDASAPRDETPDREVIEL